ncbi:hypothetical protein FRC10_001161 [Ceratobasidium sp. 414]|nr:hypothetical protein FRC10_001161 [Ceratobasidium sp. 414]
MSLYAYAYPDAAIHPPEDTIEFYREAALLHGGALWSRIVLFCSIRRSRIHVHHSRVYHSFRASAPGLFATVQGQARFAHVGDAELEQATRAALDSIIGEWDAAIERDRAYFEDLRK